MAAAIAAAPFTAAEAWRLAAMIGVDWKEVDFDQFRTGLNVELEHGECDLQNERANDDECATAKRALAHLKETPDYYTRLSMTEPRATGELSRR